MKTILFAFYGRRANMDAQLPFLRRITAEHPDVDVHLWNLCRNPHDADHLHTISGNRITVRDDHYNPENWWASLDEVWRHYTADTYRDHLFVKIDDDVPFIDTRRFADFLTAIEANPTTIISADVINNGACTHLHPDLWDAFRQLGIPLLGVHESNSYAQAAHRYAHTHLADVLGRPVELVPTSEWLSINLIGLNHRMLSLVARTLGTSSPAHISGRDWPPTFPLGDEGAVNMFRRAILKGFTACHLTFGPQNCTDEQQAEWLSEYAKIGKNYLA